MFQNRFLLVLGVLSILLVTMAVSRPLSNAPSSADLSWPPRPVINSVTSSNASNSENLNWPPRPVIIPVARTTQFSDYYARHSDESALAGVAIPVTGISAASDYFQRHTALIAPAGAGIAVDMTDYYVRHAELRTSSKSADLSDYFLRH